MNPLLEKFERSGLSLLLRIWIFKTHGEQQTQVFVGQVARVDVRLTIIERACGCQKF